MLRPRKMTVRDLIHISFSLRSGKIELLHDRVVLLNILRDLHLDIQFSLIIAIGDVVSKVLYLVHRW